MHGPGARADLYTVLNGRGAKELEQPTRDRVKMRVRISRLEVEKTLTFAWFEQLLHSMGVALTDPIRTRDAALILYFSH